MDNEIINKQEQIAALRKYGALSERSKAYWGDDERQQLEVMFCEGVDISEMALHFQRTELAILNQLISMNLYQKRRQTSPKEPKCRCSQCDLREDCKKCTEKEN